ncbi:hypothetical protein CFPU101_21600 [Chroococcus sp. FPU101]|nr:hypothetical protein CFPU101_21600 [Chroococcus sp. FPU101]
MSNNVIDALLARFRTSSEPSKPEPSQWETPFAFPMEVHIVDKQDIFYKKGRVLAEHAYRRTWKTENLLDGNDYAVVVSQKGTVIGNLNLQLRSKDKPLKSEMFFGQEHWQSYFNLGSTGVAEISALAISHELPQEMSRPVMMLLILGISSLCRLKEISLLATVQHEFLIRVLKQSLQMPFIWNEKVQTPSGKLPNDNYWNRKEPPKLYYLDTNSQQAVSSCASFFWYLNALGIQTAFLPRVQTEELTYATFRKSDKSRASLMSLNLAI